MRRFSITKTLLVIAAATLAFFAPLLVLKFMLFIMLMMAFTAMYAISRFKRHMRKHRPVYMRQIVVEDAQLL